MSTDLDTSAPSEIDLAWADGVKSISWDVSPPMELDFVVVSQEMAQQTRMSDGKPDFWDDGRPKKKVIITIRVKPDNADDDGLRRLHVNIPGGPHTAIRDACRSAKLKTLSTGDRVKLTFTAETDEGVDGKKLQRGQKRKLFEALVTSASEPPF